MPATRSVKRFPETAYVGVVVHHRQYAKRLLQGARKIEIAPSADVRRQRDPLPIKLHRPAESYPAALKSMASRPIPGNTRDLIQHPLAGGFAIRGARRPFQHAA